MTTAAAAGGDGGHLGTGPPLRLLLVDDHLAFRQPLAFMLQREPDLAVVGQAGSVAEARRLLADADVALVDLDLPDGDGVELIRELRAANPRGQAVVLSASAGRADLARAVEAGAVGGFHKALAIDELVAGLRRLGRGEPLLAPTETIELLRLAGRQREGARAAREAAGRLTPREIEVLQALAEGLSDAEIGQRLHIARETVRTHMVHLLGKLGLDSRLQALVFGVRQGLVKIGAGAGG